MTENESCGIAQAPADKMQETVAPQIVGLDAAHQAVPGQVKGNAHIDAVKREQAIPV